MSRAALLSSKIHREINAGRWVDAAIAGEIDFTLTTDEIVRGPSRAAFVFGWFGVSTSDEKIADDPFYRLGAELRSIVLGNAAARTSPGETMGPGGRKARGDE